MSLLYLENCRTKQPNADRRSDETETDNVKISIDLYGKGAIQILQIISEKKHSSKEIGKPLDHYLMLGDEEFQK